MRWLIALIPVVSVMLVTPVNAGPYTHGDVRDRCELQVKILKDHSLHVLEKCDGKETFHEDWGLYHPRGGPHDEDHRCKLHRVERIDRHGYIVYSTCRYAKVQRPLVIQLTGNDTILLTNPENY